MAPRYPYWVHEQHPDHRGPTSTKLLMLAVLAVLVSLALQLVAATDSGAQPTPSTRPPACARHFPPTCQEAARGR
jgi:hypothetical protein